MPPLQILLVEDNPTDVMLAREALSNIDIAHNLHVVRDGNEAMLFLDRENDYRDAPKPDFIFLDLNLPGKNGQEILSEIKKVKTLKAIPVIVLSTSDAPNDINLAYEMHANCYIVKPSSFDRFIVALSTLFNFWLNLAKLPER